MNVARLHRLPAVVASHLGVRDMSAQLVMKHQCVSVITQPTIAPRFHRKEDGIELQP